MNGKNGMSFKILFKIIFLLTYEERSHFILMCVMSLFGFL